MESARLFTITPMSQRFTLEPGQTYEGTVTVINPSHATEDFHYIAYPVPYGVVDQEYGADFVTESSYTKIKDWITISDPTGTLAPNQVGTVHFTITVPESVPGGGQYAAIVVSQDDQSSTSTSDLAVKDIFEVASLIYAEVNGETVHAGEILENNVPGFITGAPIEVSALISNTGNIHENAAISLKATDRLTGQVIVGNDEVPGNFSEVIMPETTRLITRNITDGLPILGIVHVEQTIAYNGAVSEIANDVIICPAWFLILTGLVIGTIIGIITRLIYKHRKKHRQPIR